MGCTTCGQSKPMNTSNVKVGEVVNPCNKQWMIPVPVLPSPQAGSRQYIYVIPSNQYFVLSYDGTQWNEIPNGAAFYSNYALTGPLLLTDQTDSGSKYKLKYRDTRPDSFIVDLNVTKTVEPNTPIMLKYTSEDLGNDLVCMGYKIDASTDVELAAFQLIVTTAEGTSIVPTIIPLNITDTLVSMTIDLKNETPVLSIRGQLVYNFISTMSTKLPY